MFNPQPKHKVVLLTGKAYTELRYSTFSRAEGLCEDCGAWAPFRIDDVFDVFGCGHMAHIIPRKRGGDLPENVRWLCFSCHIGKEHGPRWSKLERPGATTHEIIIRGKL